MRKLLLLALLLPALALGQNNNQWTQSVAGSSGGGSGTVTSVGFTGGLISVANPTTTPAFTVAGTSGGIPYFSATSTWASSAALTANALMIGGGAGTAPSTTTTGTGVLTALGVNIGSAGAPVLFNGAGGTPSSLTATNLTGTASGLTAGNASQLLSATWVAPGTIGSTTPNTGAFTTLSATGAISTTRAASNTVAAIQLGSTSVGFGLGTNGELILFSGGSVSTLGSSIGVGLSNGFLWRSSYGASGDTSIGRASANSILFGAASGSGVPLAGATTSRTEINKAVTAIADNTATTIFTVTVPNAAHSASIEVTLTCSLGAGGAIGANEATGSTKYLVSVARTAGVNAVAGISTATATSTASVSGGSVMTVTGALGAVSGAVGANNTFTINATVSHVTGSSTNHTCFGYAVLLNANNSGITIL